MATRLGLNDKGLLLSFPPIIPKVCPQKLAITRQNESLGNKVIELGKVHLHFDHVFGEIILSGESVHAWKMIDFLMGLEFAEQLDTYRTVHPFQVPVSEVLFEYYVMVEVPAYLLNDLVLGIDDVDRDWPCLSLYGLVFMFDGGQVDVVLLVLVFFELVRGVFHFIFIK